MINAAVRYIANGYTVNWSGSPAVGVPASLYATTLDEVVYWLGRVFFPVSQSLQKAPVKGTPHIIDNNDPLLGVEANVSDVASGGFIVRQNSSISGMKMIETYAAQMDDVYAILVGIFTQPVNGGLE